MMYPSMSLTGPCSQLQEVDVNIFRSDFRGLFISPIHLQEHESSLESLHNGLPVVMEEPQVHG